jgi:y4mF family transcriptional regulator
MENIGAIIRFHRKKSGMTQLELATRCGLGKTVIFDVEKGKPTVRLSTLIKILGFLNIRMELHSPLMDLYKEQHESR